MWVYLPVPSEISGTRPFNSHSFRLHVTVSWFPGTKSTHTSACINSVPVFNHLALWNQGVLLGIWAELLRNVLHTNFLNVCQCLTSVHLPFVELSIQLVLNENTKFPEHSYNYFCCIFVILEHFCDTSGFDTQISSFFFMYIFQSSRFGGFKYWKVYG